MGFRDAEVTIRSSEDREALWRAPKPYADHFLSHSRTPLPWNENPLLYAVDPNNPLKEPTDAETGLIELTNFYLYVCAFASNKHHYTAGLHNYTNAADWALYFHPVDNPVDFSLGERRLYGITLGGGYEWDRSALTLPVECNRYELHNGQVDQSLVAGVTALNARGRARIYFYPVRTFAIGTSDNHLWRREHDLPFIWGAIEQILEPHRIESCSLARQELERWAIALGFERKQWICLVRAVVGKPPSTEYVWSGSFRLGKGSPTSAVETARRRGVQFSVLERALDELNFARNRVVHDGLVTMLDWNVETLAFLGSRFWVALLKRILAWEGVRDWTEEDECAVVGLQALAKEGQPSLKEGYAAYEQAVKRCHWQHLEQRVQERLERLKEPEPSA